MKYKLTQQQFKNLTAAVNFWLKVPRDTVTAGLNTWRSAGAVTTKPTCGSTACFGGWLPYSPYFSQLGVQRRGRFNPHPVLVENDIIVHEMKDVAEHLFGERELFASKFYWSIDRQLVREMGENASDWGLVLMRLAYVLEHAELIADPV